MTFFEIESESWEKVAQMRVVDVRGRGKRKKDQQAESKACVNASRLEGENEIHPYSS